MLMGVLVGIPVYAQEYPPIFEQYPNHISIWHIRLPQTANFSLIKDYKIIALKPEIQNNFQSLSIQDIPPDFSYLNCYGLFCRLEWMTQKRLHLPISFRLGAYSYERGLERDPNGSRIVP
jgi:hypothetical protein